MISILLKEKPSMDNLPDTGFAIRSTTSCTRVYVSFDMIYNEGFVAINKLAQIGIPYTGDTNFILFSANILCVDTNTNFRYIFNEKYRIERYDKLNSTYVTLTDQCDIRDRITELYKEFIIAIAEKLSRIALPETVQTEEPIIIYVRDISIVDGALNLCYAASEDIDDDIHTYLEDLFNGILNRFVIMDSTNPRISIRYGEYPTELV